MGCHLFERMRLKTNELLQIHWVTLVGWQVLSATLTAANVFNTLLVEHYSKTLPFLQLVLLNSILLLIHIWRIHRSDISWWKYIIIAIISFVGDVTAILAYNLTSLSSAMLFCSTVVFWVVPVSYLMYRRCFSIWQFLSLILGIGGIVMVFIADGPGDSRWLGNTFALTSAVC